MAPSPSDRAGRRGGRLWWWAAATTVGVALLEFLPLDPTGPIRRSFGDFLGSAEGHALFSGNWALFGLVAVMFVFNAVLGDELLFRGLLLPRMRGAFGRPTGSSTACCSGCTTSTSRGRF